MTSFKYIFSKRKYIGRKRIIGFVFTLKLICHFSLLKKGQSRLNFNLIIRNDQVNRNFVFFTLKFVALLY